MSWVIRSPSCSQSVISCASALLSGIVGQQLVEQISGTRHVLAGLLEQFEVDAITRREHLGEPWHQSIVFGVRGGTLCEAQRHP